MTTIRRRLGFLVIVLGLAAVQVLSAVSGPTAARQEPADGAVFPPTQETCDEYRSVRGDARAVEELFGTPEGDRVQLAEDCLLQELAQTPEPVSVALDQDANLVCARVQAAGSTGHACTDADAMEPMVVTMAAGPRRDSFLTIVVVDPQRRLGNLETSDREYSAISDVRDAGLWMTLELFPPPYPDEVRVVDTAGEVLATLLLNEDLATSEAEIETAKQTPIATEQ